MSETVDDLSAAGEGGAPPTPAAVVVACGTAPRSDVVPARGELELGRTADLDDDRMSREHATVRNDRGTWIIRDCDSRNGTFVDGERVQGEVRRRGDVVLRLGHTVFLLVADSRGYDALGGDDGEHVVGPELARVYAQVRAHAAEPMLLVHGESGAGKELVAKLFHDAGPHASGPFVAVNCAAIPEGVAERLLFGSRKGAFSGAVDAPGYLASAHGGTLFLDEIADLDLAVQAKLLRVLEQHEVLPVGATSPVAVELGVVAASHRELRGEVAAKRFRDDLYYRLARVIVQLPPLRERKLDLCRLVARELAASEPRCSAHARLLEACCIRPWPGNVRELRGAIRRAAATARAAGREVVRVDDLPQDAGLAIADEPQPSRTPPSPPATLDKPAVMAALARANGVVSVAARTLGLHRTQLYRLMDKLGISRDDT
ncbi:MAG TPA: sigma 54-interacting transcriptional regulator [Kofleriaceae bacterium]|jgi:transcriptional regulator with PAS, ATPase and Fis domain